MLPDFSIGNRYFHSLTATEQQQILDLQKFLIRYANNISDSRKIDLRELEKDIKALKGIGEKRAEEIMSVIEKHLGV